MKYISFDPATKTFGYAIVEIDENIFKNNYKELLSRAKLILYSGLMDKVDDIMIELDAAISDMKSKIKIFEANTIDLLPGTADDDISIVDRIKLLKPVADNIKLKYDNTYKVFIEYQMVHNIKSASIAHALMAYFAEYDITIVTPTLKNNISFMSGPKYSDFTHYKSSYTSNKKHSEANLQHIVKYFGPHGQVKISSHTADCVLQIIGAIN
jgi:hypothetical protein